MPTIFVTGVRNKASTVSCGAALDAMTMISVLSATWQINMIPLISFVEWTVPIVQGESLFISADFSYPSSASI